MNKELLEIIRNTECKLQELDKPGQTEYDQVLEETKKLQKQLLNASLLEKPNLETKIKNQLKLKENRLAELSSNQTELELGYLKTYIRESYD